MQTGQKYAPKFNWRPVLFVCEKKVKTSKPRWQGYRVREYSRTLPSTRRSRHKIILHWLHSAPPWCHPVFKGVTHACSEISERPLFSALLRTILDKLLRTSCKNNDRFAFKIPLFFFYKLKDASKKKNPPISWKLGEEHENFRLLWHKHDNGLLNYSFNIVNIFHFEDTVLYKDIYIYC